MDRAEATGVGVSLAGHAALLAALTLGLTTVTRPPVTQAPIDVMFVDEVGLESAAPVPSAEAPAARLAEVEGPVEPAPALVPLPEPRPLPEPAPPAPAPVPEPAERPQPKAKAREPEPAPKPKAVERAKAAPSAAKAPARKASEKAGTQSSGRLRGLLDGISERDTDSRATAPRAQVAGAAVQASLAAEVLRQLRPHWQRSAPTGAEVELLRTELAISLAPNGTVTNVEVLRTTGQTDSNRPQVKRHQEGAVRAAQLASPFRLPAEYYDTWKLLKPIRFDKRLTQ